MAVQAKGSKRPRARPKRAGIAADAGRDRRDLPPLPPRRPESQDRAALPGSVHPSRRRRVVGAGHRRLGQPRHAGLFRIADTPRMLARSASRGSPRRSRPSGSIAEGQEPDRASKQASGRAWQPGARDPRGLESCPALGGRPQTSCSTPPSASPRSASTPTSSGSPTAPGSHRARRRSRSSSSSNAWCPTL